MIGYGTELNQALDKQFLADLGQASAVQYRSEKGLLRRLFGSIARLTSPLL